ncbi:MAG: hypothetical protein DCO96_09860 [Fluviicola sp. XM-24bin1]|nr:MAG: hypothetical protein DCO96_09860 [Fluviicola sp. XM-24bin1]
MDADGIVGPNTWKVLNASTDLEENPEKEEPKENTKPVEEVSKGSISIKQQFLPAESTKKGQRIKNTCFYIIRPDGTIHIT